MGFLGGAVVIGTLIAIIAILAISTKLNRVFLFWIAFVLTRPFGATFGDLLTKPIAHGGLNLGTQGASAVLAGLLVITVLYSMYQNKR
ncbi:MAG: hypothetical protein WC733_00270 [Methylophilus sp.]